MEKIHSLVHAKKVRLPRRCLKMRLQLYIRAICHGHRCIDGILLSSSANTVGASWLQRISWREPIRDGKIFWMNHTAQLRMEKKKWDSSQNLCLSIIITVNRQISSIVEYYRLIDYVFDDRFRLICNVLNNLPRLFSTALSQTFRS